MKQRKRTYRRTFSNWIIENEFLALLLALSAFLFIPSFITEKATRDTVIYSLLLLLLVAGVFELRHIKSGFITGSILAILVIIVNMVDFSANEPFLFLARMGSLIIFFLLLTGHVLYRLAISRRISSNIIYCAVSGYLLLGLIGGLSFRLIHHIYENSFQFISGLEPKVDDFTYLSFVTLATLGYGDITPVSAPAKALSVFLSVAGQMYLVIVIGLIIGKFNYYRNIR